MGTLLGSNAALVWFWDLASLNSLRALPYVQEWHRRYGEAGLRMIGVHSPQFDFGHDPDVVAGAVRRLEIPFPVAVDSGLRDLAPVRKRGVARALPVGPARRAAALPLRRGRVRGDRSGDRRDAAEIDESIELPAPLAPLRPTDRPGRTGQAPHPPHLPQQGPFRARRGPGRAAAGPVCGRRSGRGAGRARQRRGAARRRAACARSSSTGRGFTSWSRPRPMPSTSWPSYFDSPARAYAFSFVAGPA